MKTSQIILDLGTLALHVMNLAFTCIIVVFVGMLFTQLTGINF